MQQFFENNFSIGRTVLYGFMLVILIKLVKIKDLHSSLFLIFLSVLFLRTHSTWKGRLHA